MKTFLETKYFSIKILTMKMTFLDKRSKMQQSWMCRFVSNHKHSFVWEIIGEKFNIDYTFKIKICGDVASIIKHTKRQNETKLFWFLDRFLFQIGYFFLFDCCWSLQILNSKNQRDWLLINKYVMANMILMWCFWHFLCVIRKIFSYVCDKKIWKQHELLGAKAHDEVAKETKIEKCSVYVCECYTRINKRRCLKACTFAA